jgi:hypothetical protein
MTGHPHTLQQAAPRLSMPEQTHEASPHCSQIAASPSGGQTQLLSPWQLLLMGLCMLVGRKNICAHEPDCSCTAGTHTTLTATARSTPHCCCNPAAMRQHSSLIKPGSSQSLGPANSVLGAGWGPGPHCSHTNCTRCISSSGVLYWVVLLRLDTCCHAAWCCQRASN